MLAQPFKELNQVRIIQILQQFDICGRAFGANVLNSGSVIDTGYRPRSGPSLCNGAKGCKVAHQSKTALHEVERHVSGI